MSSFKKRCERPSKSSDRDHQRVHGRRCAVVFSLPEAVSKWTTLAAFSMCWRGRERNWAGVPN